MLNRSLECASILKHSKICVLNSSSVKIKMNLIRNTNVNNNTYLAYKQVGNLERNRKFKSENFDWDKSNPRSLNVLCVDKISETWKEQPNIDLVLQKDKELFLQILDTEVPLSFLVDNIKSDIFWKRSYKSKWKDDPKINEHRLWINIYMERHFCEILENINPNKYDPEKITALVKLCGPYIKHLSIRSLVPVDLPTERMISPEMADLITSYQRQELQSSSGIKNEEIIRDHISLHAALGSLTNLTELHLTYQLKSTGVNFRKDQFQFTNNDAKSVARGLEKCYQLRTLRITRSDLNCTRVKYILRSLSDHQKLECLDFSHCKIGDEGALSVAKYISKHDHAKHLVLVDNVFGPPGAEGIAYALNNSGCGVRALDLRLNSRIGSEGVGHIAVALARGCNLNSLNISGCGIKPGPLSKTPPGVWSMTSQETPPSCGDLLARAIGLARTPLRSLDISVNDIGILSGAAIANAICLSFLVEVNLKRSGIGSTAMAIGESAAAAQKLRREAEKGIRFRRSAGRLLQARRVARAMNIEADTVLLAQQLSARPSIVSVTSEEGTYSVQAQPLPTDFGFIPAFKNPLSSSRASSLTGPPTSRRSSHHQVLEPVKEVRRSALVRRGSDGSLLQSRADSQRHIKIFVSNNQADSDDD